MILFDEQKIYFKKKLEGVQKMIWDLEFKRYKTRELREEVRQDYDQLKAKLEILTNKIKEQEEKFNKTFPFPFRKEETTDKWLEAHADYFKDHDRNLVDEFKRLEDQEVIVQRDISRREEQMKTLDTELEGSHPTSEYPDGITGISQQLDGLREFQIMINDYIKQI